MKKKPFEYRDLSHSEKNVLLKDLAVAAQYGSLPADRRLQLTMPAFIVEELDKAFPGIDRNKLFTKMALEMLLRKFRYADAPHLQELVDLEQEGLDTMWSYLEERDQA